MHGFLQQFRKKISRIEKVKKMRKFIYILPKMYCSPFNLDKKFQSSNFVHLKDFLVFFIKKIIVYLLLLRR